MLQKTQRVRHNCGQYWSKCIVKCLCWWWFCKSLSWGGLCDSFVNPAVSLCHADTMYVPHAEGTECSRTCIFGYCTTLCYPGQSSGVDTPRCPLTFLYAQYDVSWMINEASLRRGAKMWHVKFWYSGLFVGAIAEKNSWNKKKKRKIAR